MTFTSIAELRKLDCVLGKKTSGQQLRQRKNWQVAADPQLELFTSAYFAFLL